MNITVYCGSMIGNDPAYEKAAATLGAWIARHGHRLVYGGGGVGLMGAVSDAVLNEGGEVVGIMPEFLVEREASQAGLTELLVTKSMAERKSKMMELGDAFIALPGGPGTIEEITEVMSLEKLGQLSGPCILYSVNGYYDTLACVYDEQVEHGFARPSERANLIVARSLEAISSIIEDWQGPASRIGE